MRKQTYTLTEVPVTSSEKYMMRKMPMVLKNVTADKILMYLFETADFYKNVYQVIYTDKDGCGHTFSVGEFNWEKDKKEIADKFIAHKKAHDVLYGTAV